MTGIVDQYVNAAEGCDCISNTACNVGAFGDIGDNSNGRTAGGSDLRYKSV
jgi:hypothetical protein